MMSHFAWGDRTMFHCRAWTRLLWRILLAQSLTIAVALLIEIGMVEQVLAVCDCSRDGRRVPEPVGTDICKPDRRVLAKFPDSARKGSLVEAVLGDNPSLKTK